MRKGGIVLSLRGQVILQWLVLVHLDKIIPADEVLSQVGGLSGGSTCHITPTLQEEDQQSIDRIPNY